MRDVIVVSIVVIWAVMALKRPWMGVLLWTWLSLMNPHRFTWGFAYDAPLAAIAAITTLLGLLMTRERQSPFLGTPVGIFAAFVIWITLSWLFGIDTDGDYLQWSKVMKIYFMTFIALMLLHTKHHIIAFAWVTAASLAILGAKGGVFTILHGGSFRVWGPPGTFIEDNNEFALALIITIPLLHFLQQQVINKWVRHGLSATMFLCAASALGSHSRGALLAIAAMGAMLWLRSRRKGSTSVLILVFLLAILPMMPEEWWSRMETIGTYDEDQSAQGRIYAWGVAWEVAKNALFGAGMSYQNAYIFALYGNGSAPIAAHSIYFQVLGNHGFVGLFIFVCLWFASYSYGGWLNKNAMSIPEAKWAANLGGMVQVALVGYAVGGAFLSLAYFDLPYYMMVMVVIARKWVETKAWEREPQVPFLEYAGLRKPKPSTASSLSAQRITRGY
jgi:probable O-glycosylation ligase (exosortase A-associated)